MLYCRRSLQHEPGPSRLRGRLWLTRAPIALRPLSLFSLSSFSARLQRSHLWVSYLVKARRQSG